VHCWEIGGGGARGGGGGGAHEQGGHGLGDGQLRGGGGGGLRPGGELVGGQRGQGGGGGALGQGLLPGGPTGQGGGGGQGLGGDAAQPVSALALQNLVSCMRCLRPVADLKLGQSSSHKQQGLRRGMAVSSQALA
jgi:hypothetical protein